MLVLFMMINSWPMSAYANDKPIVVLIERDPWLMVLGSDSPTVALYSDGEFIVKKTDGSGYVHSFLSIDARQTLLSKLELESLSRLENSYTVSEWTDQPTNELHLWVGGQYKSISVYGNIRAEAEARAKTPLPFIRAFDSLTASTPSTATLWLPPLIEVLIWPYEHSPEEPLAWPSEWPQFEQARPRGSHGLYQLLLPSEQYPRLIELLRTLKTKQAIRFADRKWTIAYRIPFPHESDWSK
jgi:hypothetical protein